eukprot:scaffold7774_cov430-Prasinococcus_capsulatus_cf.AAC.1
MIGLGVARWRPAAGVWHEIMFTYMYCISANHAASGRFKMAPAARARELGPAPQRNGRRERDQSLPR